MNIDARKVRKLREARGWTQVELAKKLGIHKQSMTNVENNMLNLGGKRLRHLAELLGVTVDELAKAPAPAAGTGDVMVLWTPVYGTVPPERFRLSFDAGPDDYVPVVSRKNDNLFALRMAGDALAAQLRDGDYAVFLKQDWANPGDVVVVKAGDYYTIQTHPPAPGETIAVVGKLYGSFRRPV